ncbi:mandelate racemase/muconate lactonizing enzyme family protein [Nonomuraea sp. NPDC055795]
MKLRIVDVERVVVRVPFRERARPWNELLVGQFGVIEVLRVRTDDPDIVGYGETLPHYTWQTVSETAVARVTGGNPAEFLADDSLGAGLQMALFDIVGKALGVPMHRLLNLPLVRDWCPISWWSTKMPADVLAQEAAEALSEGYRSHKLKARPWFDIREQVAAIAGVTPPDFALDIDWNGMLLTPGQAVEVLRELDREERVGIYESPIKQDDVAGFRSLRARVDRPLAEHYTKTLLPEWIRQDALDGFVLCLAGVSGLIAQGQHAAAFQKNCWLQVVGAGLTTAFTLHLGGVLTHARWPAVTCLNVYADDLIEDPIEIRGGYARIPGGPGLGVTVDEAALEKYRMAAPYTVEYPRRLLTFDLGDGRARHYATITQLFDECRYIGTMPVQPRGARLVVTGDDGSATFADLYGRAAVAPVWDAGVR